MAGRLNIPEDRTMPEGSASLAPLSEARDPGRSYVTELSAMLFLGVFIGIIVAVIIQNKFRKWQHSKSNHQLKKIKSKAEKAHSKYAAPVPEIIDERGKKSSAVSAIDNSMPATKILSSPHLPKKLKDYATEKIQVGQKLHLHFLDIIGHFAGTVINVGNNGFVITMAAEGATVSKLNVTDGHLVEGMVVIQETAYRFKSVITEFFRGGVLACRIAHTDEFTEYYRRNATRVPLNNNIRVRYFPGSRELAGEVDLSTLDSQLSPPIEAVIKDISIGGCRILCQSNTSFALGDFLQLDIKVLSDEPQLLIFANIVYSEELSYIDGGGSLVHLEFMGLDEKSQISIERTLCVLQEDEEF